MKPKQCSICKLPKPISQFYLSKGKPKSACKACELAKLAEKRLQADSQRLRTCSKCHVDKSLDQFTKHSSVCKDCVSVPESSIKREAKDFVMGCKTPSDLPNSLKPYALEYSSEGSMKAFKSDNMIDILGKLICSRELAEVERTREDFSGKFGARLKQSEYIELVDEKYFERFGVHLTTKFDLSWSVYSAGTDKWLVKCREHDVHFAAKIGHLLHGNGCPLCGEVNRLLYARLIAAAKLICEEHATIQWELNGRKGTKHVQPIVDVIRELSYTIEGLWDGAEPIRSEKVLKRLVEAYSGLKGVYETLYSGMTYKEADRLLKAVRPELQIEFGDMNAVVTPKIMVKLRNLLTSEFEEVTMRALVEGYGLKLVNNLGGV